MPHYIQIVPSIRRTAAGKIDFRRVEQVLLQKKNKSS
jgi:non-ribosomal peptide synthetase component E (peptide arylation enzyme)